jgi:hypothetical protein
VIDANSTRMAPWTTRLTNQADVSRTFGDRLNQVVGFDQIRFFSTVATLRFQNDSPGHAAVFASSAILNNINRFGNYEVPANPYGLEYFVRRQFSSARFCL